jgi:hypothetical protein
MEVPRLTYLRDPFSSEQSWLSDSLRSPGESQEPMIFHLGENSTLFPPWTPASLSARVPVLSRTYTSKEPRFGPYHDNERPLARAFGLRPRHNYSEASISSADLFGSSTELQDDDDDRNYSYHYYSGEVERDLTPMMLSELRPLERALIARAPSRASVNLWLGRKPVSAPCHFDGYHNAFAQLSGRKRFLLAPPSAWRRLRPFPFLHPSHAQCQTTLDSLQEEELVSLGVRTAELTRGDVLYLPPLWFHETLALSEEGAVSVNGWVECDEGAAAAELFALKLPGRLQAGAAPSDRALDAASLVMLLSSASFGNASLLPARLWTERYKAIVEDGSLPQSAVGNAASGDGEAPPIDCALLAANRELWEMSGHGIGWARAATRLAAERFHEETRASWLGNLAEYVAAERVGVRAVGGFWHSLFACASEVEGLVRVVTPQAETTAT